MLSNLQSAAGQNLGLYDYRFKTIDPPFFIVANKEKERRCIGKVSNLQFTSSSILKSTLIIKPGADIHVVIRSRVNYQNRD